MRVRGGVSGAPHRSAIRTRMLRDSQVVPRGTSRSATATQQAVVLHAARTSNPYTLTDDPRLPTTRQLKPPDPGWLTT